MNDNGNQHSREKRTTLSLLERFALPRPVLLDGATGTEIERRGLGAELPIWSSHALLDAPARVEEIHRDYALAGAEIITANTFRTQARVLERDASTRGRAPELTRLAVSLARSAANENRSATWIAGSAPPLEDCYRPDLVPEVFVLAAEHRDHAENLVSAGVDLILIETMNCIVEARVAAEAAVAAGLPFVVSFVCGTGGVLLSGEPLARALDAVAVLAPVAVGINCMPPSAVPDCIPTLAESGIPFGISANLGAPNPSEGPESRSEQRGPEDFADLGHGWIAAGARFIGGCCGTTPDHIRALSRMIEQNEPVAT